MKPTIRVWRQENSADKGRLVDYPLDGVEPDMSFLEMMDVLNERLILAGQDPVAFDHDCREAICGVCSMAIGGVPHGPEKASTTCQLYMRHFEDGDTITVEPWRAAAFPVIKDLVVDRSVFDRIIQAGGYVSAPTGSAPEAASTPVPHEDATNAFDAATCIGCGACVAACPNASATLFTAAKVTTCRCCRRGSRSATSGSPQWLCRWMPRASAAAQTPASVLPCARRASRWNHRPDERGPAQGPLALTAPSAPAALVGVEGR